MSDRETFERELAAAVNRCSRENGSNTPDFILGQFLAGCLAAWDTAVQQRETWYGRDARPLSTPVPPRSTPPADERLKATRTYCWTGEFGVFITNGVLFCHVNSESDRDADLVVRQLNASPAVPLPALQALRDEMRGIAEGKAFLTSTTVSGWADELDALLSGEDTPL